MIIERFHYSEKHDSSIQPYNRKILRRLWELGMFFGIILFFLFLSYLLTKNTHTKQITKNWDFWFGCDTVLYILWMNIPEYVERSYLHPASLLVYKSYGWFLAKVGFLPNYKFLPVLAFPVILYTSIATVFTVRMMFPSEVFPLWLKSIALFLMFIIGPLLIFTNVPESHLLGGISLLLQAVFVWYLMTYKNDLKKHQNHGRGKEKKAKLAVLFFAILATGFSLSNLMPATILLLIFPAFRRIIIKIGIIGFLAGGILYIIHQYIIFIPFVSTIKESIFNETPWLSYPDFYTFSLSVQNFLLTQFGLSSPYLSVALPPSTDEGVFIALSKPSFLQITASLLWLGGIFFWLIKNSKRSNSESQFIIFCILSFISLLLFHSVYAIDESFMFVAHGWPFLILPGLIVLKNSWLNQNILLLICLLVSGILSSIQMAKGFYSLFHLVPLAP